MISYLGDIEAIVAKNLTKVFGTNMVVDNVSFSIKKGEIFGFLGPNGSGKSTTIRMLCGLLKPTGGYSLVQGMDSTQRAQDIQQTIGYMSQKFTLYQDLTVCQNMKFYGKAYKLGGKRLQSKIEELSEKMLLTPYMDRPAGQLSGGWKQKLALACALIHEPTILFLDEPTAGIDPVARKEVWDMLYELSLSGVTILVTTHYMDEAQRCHKLGYIYLGTLIALGTNDELVQLFRSRLGNGYRHIVLKDTNVLPLYNYLNGHPKVRDLAFWGANIHCSIPDSISESGFRQAISTDVSVDNLKIEESEPSLEQIFSILSEKKREESV